MFKFTALLVLTALLGLVASQESVLAPTYDCQSYVDRYEDLAEAYGTDCADPTIADALYKHFLEFGQKEGRDAAMPESEDEEDKEEEEEDEDCDEDSDEDSDEECDEEDCVPDDFVERWDPKWAKHGPKDWYGYGPKDWYGYGRYGSRYYGRRPRDYKYFKDRKYDRKYDRARDIFKGRKYDRKYDVFKDVRDTKDRRDYRRESYPRERGSILDRKKMDKRPKIARIKVDDIKGAADKFMKDVRGSIKIKDTRSRDKGGRVRGGDRMPRGGGMKIRGGGGGGKMRGGGGGARGGKGGKRTLSEEPNEEELLAMAAHEESERSSESRSLFSNLADNIGLRGGSVIRPMAPVAPATVLPANVFYHNGRYWTRNDCGILVEVLQTNQYVIPTALPATTVLPTASVYADGMVLRQTETSRETFVIDPTAIAGVPRVAIANQIYEGDVY